ncbi:hypothetical protein PIB30_005844 [Stylosanthes scabra]|uniref:Uncharacterized protein n=1 Tax=Stylosanthes scabra TaxID=79078 RepID=A0ABU6Z1W1_9FABA|nr:hypothetical protein [Stylosanthes scabra]
MRNQCFTPIPETEVVKMEINGLEFNIRKKVVNQQFLDLAQLAKNVQQIEKLNKEKEEYESSKEQEFFDVNESGVETPFTKELKLSTPTPKAKGSLANKKST